MFPDRIALAPTYELPRPRLSLQPTLNVLLVEDTPDLAASIGDYLTARGAVVDYAGDGLTGMRLASIHNYDAVLLDLGQPPLDGITFCRRLRRDGGNNVPVILLTSRDNEGERLEGFEAGADDSVAKPLSLPVLHARLAAVVRRCSSASDVLRVGDLTFDTRRLIVRRGPRALVLTRVHLRLLEALMRASPGVLTKEAAERAIWADEAPDSDANLRGHIYALRQQIDRGNAAKLLHTLHGVGYRLTPDLDQ